MEHDPFLTRAFVFLVAALIAAPAAARLGLGSVLGYLIAGAAIGPYALNLFGDAESVLHTAEFGVVIMLFLIGLELNPAMLWRMRAAILGLGGAQVALCAALLAGIGMLAGLDPRVAIACGFTLSLSSTAIVMQSLRERGLSATDAGRSTFSVLLFQDIAIIPMLALFPLLAVAPTMETNHGGISAWPGWAQTLAVFGAVGAIVLAGRVLVRPLFRFIARAGLREAFTAASLALVVGVALLMQSVGLSPALGAFIAGVVLADSEYRHELESDIEPFRGLLLGLFFISVGAGVDFALIFREPFLILAIVLGLISVKATAIYVVARIMGRPKPDAAFVALALAQGGEFAFVLFNVAASGGVVPSALANLLIAAVALSMAATPLLMMLAQSLSQRLGATAARETPTPMDNESPHALIAGFGRFGQVVGRLLIANGFRTSILDHSAEQVDLMRGFGHKTNYGDATRTDLLRAAGAEEAQVLVIAIDDPDKALELAETARRNFPHLKVLARAYDRPHAFELMRRHVDGFERETFESALRLGAKALKHLGYGAHRAERAAGLFRRHDERGLKEMAKDYQDGQMDDAYRSRVRARQALVEEALRRDLDQHGLSELDDAWSGDRRDSENEPKRA